MNVITTPGTALHILIAEASATQAQRLQHILEQHGYRVTATTNGRLALEAAQHSKPALIISDVIMPEMNGYELCGRVKADALLSDELLDGGPIPGGERFREPPGDVDIRMTAVHGPDGRPG